MSYDPSIIDQVRDANDIVSVIGQYVRLEKKGANYFGLCPFHGEKTPSFSVSPRKQIYNCFGCGKGGNVYSFIMEYENVSFPESVRILAKKANISLPEYISPENKAEKEQKDRILAIYKDAAYYYHDCLYTPEGKQGLMYLTEKRLLSRATITHFGLGYSSRFSENIYHYLKHEKHHSDEDLKASGLIVYSDKGPRSIFWNRVMFPIMDTGSRVIGFGGRVMGDGEPKYLNSRESPVFNKSSVLYGLNFAKKSREKFLLLCEGYMDVISLHQAGFTNAVASLGTAFTESHARILKRYTDTVILTQDSDEAGIKARMRSFPILHDAGLNVKVLDMGAYKDPDEFIKANGPDAYRTCINQAKNAFLYSIETLKRYYDLSDPDKVTEFYRRVAEELTVFKDKTERENYIAAVSREQSIHIDTLTELTELAFLKKQGGRQTYDAVLPEKQMIPNETPVIPVSEKVSRSEDILLSRIAETPAYAEKISEYLKPGMFSSELKKRIAGEVLDIGRTFNISSFIDTACKSEEEKKEAARIFMNRESDSEESDLSKLLSDAVRNILSDNIEKKLHDSRIQPKEFQELMLQKSRLKSIHIGI